MRKVRAKVKHGGKANVLHILLELCKSVVAGAARAVVAHWLDQP
ncbi:hypothetical protein P1X16_27570 [Hymenobacter sp. YC55]|nr:hypothetical protein [Hymenobacter sp. YC55]